MCPIYCQKICSSREREENNKIEKGNNTTDNNANIYLMFAKFHAPC